MNCPKCSGRMETAAVEDFEIDRCTKCAGLWFDLREQDHAIESADDVKRIDVGSPGIKSEHHDLNCPICKVKMLKLVVADQPHIKYESCPVCHGAFFDAGELKDLASQTVKEKIAMLFRGLKQRRSK